MTKKSWFGYLLGLSFSGFVMYSIIVIEANITVEVRNDWLQSYLIGFITSQVISPLLKALVDCLCVISLAKIDYDFSSANFVKKILGNDFMHWYNI